MTEFRIDSRTITRDKLVSIVGVSTPGGPWTDE
jgi:hypothetical protein